MHTLATYIAAIETPRALPTQRGNHRFSLDPVDDAIPSTMGHDSHSIVLEVFKSKRPAAYHFHLGVEPFGGAIALIAAPHHNNGLKP